MNDHSLQHTILIQFLYIYIYIYFRKSVKVKSQRSHPVLPLTPQRMKTLIIQLVKAKDRKREINNLITSSPQMTKHRLEKIIRSMVRL
jgi:hypothetical protein